uniref:Histone-lysine N-methyltransferase n=1 Tax=Peronospora matthiolae TaxID=2874970 RepID=A0AAV1T117_9STRA
MPHLVDESLKTGMEEQLCAQAVEALNHFIRTFHIVASTEIARNRLKSSLDMMARSRIRKEIEVLYDQCQGFRVRTSELLRYCGCQVKRTVQIQLTTPSQSVIKRVVILPIVPPVPTATMWTALAKNYGVEDEPTRKCLPYVGHNGTSDVVSELEQVKQQGSSACEVEFTMEMCEYVLRTLRSTWDLTPSDLTRVASVIMVEEEVLVEVYTNLCSTQSAVKKRRRMETPVASGKRSRRTSAAQAKDDAFDRADRTISMKEYFQLYEKAADSYRSLFCRRCFVYDCDYHGCMKQPNLSILEQNAVALNVKEKGVMINTGRNCGNGCFLGQVSVSSCNEFVKARVRSTGFAWSERTSVLCVRAYMIYSGNFCQMAKMVGNTTCVEVAEMCANDNINGSSLPKDIQARSSSKSRCSRKAKRMRKLVVHAQNSQNGVGDTVRMKIEPCSHLGPCQKSVCSCVNSGISCSKHCHCIHDECKIFFSGCRCQHGRCRTETCPCFRAGRECDIDFCKVCSADEIAAREKGEPYDVSLGKAQKDDTCETRCRNRSIALGEQKLVRMGRSKLGVAEWGLFVDEFVAEDEFIIEFIGEMVSQEEADQRRVVYGKDGSRYLIELDTKIVVDSTRKGNKARLVNHSSASPNCVCKIMNVGSDFRIGLYALHDMQPQTELFFDHGYSEGSHNDEMSSDRPPPSGIKL